VAIPRSRESRVKGFSSKHRAAKLRDSELPVFTQTLQPRRAAALTTDS